MSIRWTEATLQEKAKWLQNRIDRLDENSDDDKDWLMENRDLFTDILQSVI